MASIPLTQERSRRKPTHHLCKSSLSFGWIQLVLTAELIGDDKIKEQDVRDTLEKIDPDKIVNVEELATKLSNIAEQSKSTIEELKHHSDTIISSAKASLSVLQKPSQQPNLTEEEEMARHEDIIAFYN